MASAFALAIFSGKIVLLYEWKMTAVIFHSPFHAWGCAGKLQLPIERLTAFSSDTSSGCGTQHSHRALGGTCVLLAAAPTATLCFRRWRRSLLLQAIPSPALLPCGQQGPTPADGPQRNFRRVSRQTTMAHNEYTPQAFQSQAGYKSAPAPGCRETPGAPPWRQARSPSAQ